MRFIAQLVLSTDFEDILERTLAAERAGFSAVVVPDHFNVPEDRPKPGGIAESWTTLAALAARTDAIRIGGAVMCNLFRHPCLTAQIAATVDQISGGRLELGLGAGWMEEEFRRTGMAFPSAGVRIHMLEESLEIILPALEGKTVDFEGEHYQVRDFVLSPGCIQKPRPPLHVGGGGDKVLRVAARYADIVSLVPPAPHGRVSRSAVVAFDGERLTERIRYLRRNAEEFGRDPAAIEVIDFTGVVNVTETDAETVQALDGMAQVFNTEAAAIREHPLTLIGTPAQIVATLQERRERWGIDAVMVSTLPTETLELFGKEIIPKV